MMLLLVGLPAGAEAAGGEAWHKSAWEFAAVESAMLLAILLLAMAFEICWHRLTHWVEGNTFKFSGAVPGHGGLAHRQLHAVLLHRMGGEFMTLGVLALLVFICERYGIFSWMADTLKGCADDHDDHTNEECLHLPDSGLDWFHMAEIVHFSLFTGMLLYFVQMLCLIAGSVRNLRAWQRVRRRSMAEPIRTPTRRALVRRQQSDQDWLGSMEADRQYQCMQDRFFSGLVLWQSGKFNRLLDELGITSDSPDPIDLVPATAAGTLFSVDGALRGPRFDFSAYLALNVEDAVDDAIEIHISAWFMVWLFLLVSLALHLVFHWTFSLACLWLVVVPTLVWLLLCVHVFRREQSSLLDRSDRWEDFMAEFALDFSGLQQQHGGEWSRMISPGSSGSSDSTEDAAEQHASTHSMGSSPLVGYVFFQGHHLMRFAQIAGFIQSYVLARQVFEPPDWKDQYQWALLTTIIMAINWVCLSSWFFWHAPIFLAMMSMPPRCSGRCEDVFWQLLHHESGTHGEDARTLPAQQALQQLPRITRRASGSQAAGAGKESASARMLEVRAVKSAPALAE